jgi:glycosyltransferase involved in cell wall biosynthesis
MRILYVQRKAGPGVYSLESYFSLVRQHLPPGLNAEIAVAPRESRGVWPRIANIFWARRQQADVTHITGDIHYLTYLLDKRRTVLTVLDCVFVQNPSRLRRALLRLLWLKLPEQRVAVITTISEFTRQQVIAETRCDPEKVKVVYACASPRFRRLDKPWNGQLPTVLHVGTTFNKNLERLCQALEGITCRLHVIGALSASQREALRGLDYVNSVHLSDEQMLQAYEDCDMLAFVSTYEGFGLPIVEANAVGRPVVTSRIASMPEVAGNAACLVDPFDVGSIRSGLLKVLESADYRRELVENGLENAKRFDPSLIAHQYAELYRGLKEPVPDFER